MQNQLIPTEELEMLVSEMNDRLDALEIKVAEVTKRERIILLNDKQKEIEHIQKQFDQINEAANRNRSITTIQPALVIHPKYSV